MRLAVDGIVDFSQLDYRNPAWGIRLCWLAKEFQRGEMLKFLRYEQKRHLGYMASGLQSDSWNKHRELELKRHDEIVRVLFDLGKENDQKQRLEAGLRKAWAEHWGDPNDAETQKKIDATAEALRRRRMKEVKDDPTGRNIV